MHFKFDALRSGDDGVAGLGGMVGAEAALEQTGAQPPFGLGKAAPDRAFVDAQPPRRPRQ